MPNPIVVTAGTTLSTLGRAAGSTGAKEVMLATSAGALRTGPTFVARASQTSQLTVASAAFKGKQLINTLHAEDVLQLLGMLEVASVAVDTAVEIKSQVAEFISGLGDSFELLVNPETGTSLNVSMELDTLKEELEDELEDDYGGLPFVTFRYMIPTSTASGVKPHSVDTAVAFGHWPEFCQALGVNVPNPLVADADGLRLYNCLSGFVASITAPYDRLIQVPHLGRGARDDVSAVATTLVREVPSEAMRTLSQFGGVQAMKNTWRAQNVGDSTDSWVDDDPTIEAWLESTGACMFTLLHRHPEARAVFVRVPEGEAIPAPALTSLSINDETSSVVTVYVPSGVDAVDKLLAMNTLALVAPELALAAVGSVDVRALKTLHLKLLKDNPNALLLRLLSLATGETFYHQMVEWGRVYRHCIRRWTNAAHFAGAARLRSLDQGTHMADASFRVPLDLYAVETEVVVPITGGEREVDLIVSTRHEVTGPMPPQNRAVFIPNQTVELKAPSFPRAVIRVGAVHAVCGWSAAGKTSMIMAMAKLVEERVERPTRFVLVLCDEPHDRRATSGLASEELGFEVEVFKISTPHPSVVDSLQRTVTEKYPGEHVIMMIDSATILQHSDYVDNGAGGASEGGVQQEARPGITWLSQLAHEDVTTFAVFNIPNEHYWKLLHGGSSMAYWVASRTASTGPFGRLIGWRDRFGNLFEEGQGTVTSEAAGDQWATHGAMDQDYQGQEM